MGKPKSKCGDQNKAQVEGLEGSWCIEGNNKLSTTPY